MSGLSHPVARDRSYTVGVETTAKGDRYVARHAGTRLGESLSYSAAAILCVGHHARANGAQTIEGVPS